MRIRLNKTKMINSFKAVITPLPIPNRVSLCSPNCPRTCCIDQAGLKFREPPASASSTTWLSKSFLYQRNDCYLEC